jgi:hypothetical protein
MRLMITADLHYNHARSRVLADELIERINAETFDLLLLVGDTAAGDSDSIEQCLTRFSFNGPRLFVPGNHELWTKTADSYELFGKSLARRVEEVGWNWLPGKPFVNDRVAIVGALGWYDYSFAQEELGIPRRFYERKMSPGAARYNEIEELFGDASDIPASAMEIYARWNDGKFVKLARSDEDFLDEQLAVLRSQLNDLRGHPRVLAAIHHLPFRELLPPARTAQWDFAKAYLGSEKIGQLLLEYPNVGEVFCGHSHFPAEARVGHIRAMNIGSGYRWKTFQIVDV